MGLRGARRPAQAAAGFGNGLMLQVAPTDGAHDVLCKHGHPGARFTRGRAFGRLHPHETSRSTLQGVHQ
ncbi:hypothetical protein D3C71_2028750 [compost metagenome]